MRTKRATCCTGSSCSGWSPCRDRDRPRSGRLRNGIPLRNAVRSLSLSNSKALSVFQPELLAPGGVEKVLHLRMLLHVGGKEGADRDDLQSAFSCRIQRVSNWDRADTLALMRLGDLR